LSFHAQLALAALTVAAVLIAALAWGLWRAHRRINRVIAYLHEMHPRLEDMRQALANPPQRPVDGLTAVNRPRDTQPIVLEAYRRSETVPGPTARGATAYGRHRRTP